MAADCRLGVAYGKASALYSFPGGHPMNSSRTEVFGRAIAKLGGEKGSKGRLSVVEPVMATDEEVMLFHTPAYVDFVRQASKAGHGKLDYGDTPAFPGVYEASLYTVGSTLEGVSMVVGGRADHFFNPVGGLHHARRDRAGGFCVFNDAAVAVVRLLDQLKLRRVAYVDIDAHHGDGVFYAFESDPRVIIGDIHEDGRYLYPGTGDSSETGSKGAEGTKLNVPMRPGSTDADFFKAFDEVYGFLEKARPEFILLQCGADCLAGDPITQLSYTPAVHRYAARRLHGLAHEICEGRLVAMGGGGYDPLNVAEGWGAVVSELSGLEFPRADPSALGPWW